MDVSATSNAAGAAASNFSTAQNAPRAVANGTQYWLFQANPTKYDIHKALEDEREDMWNLRQHAAKVRVGDRVVIWVCGEGAGIYAIGTVMTPPVVQEDTPEGQARWKTADGAKRYPRVRVRFDRVLRDRPLTKPFLLTDPVLSGLKVLAMPQGTNYVVTEKEWQELQTWIGSAPVPTTAVIATDGGQPLPQREKISSLT